MDPAIRTVLQVNVEEATVADRVLQPANGEEVAPRKAFIQSHYDKSPQPRRLTPAGEQQESAIGLVTLPQAYPHIIDAGVQENMLSTPRRADRRLPPRSGCIASTVEYPDSTGSPGCDCTRSSTHRRARCEGIRRYRVRPDKIHPDCWLMNGPNGPGSED